MLPLLDLLVTGPSPPAEWATESLTGLLSRCIPTGRTVLVEGPVLGAAALLAGGAASWLRRRCGLRPHDSRKVFHFLVFSLAGLLHLTRGLDRVCLWGGIVSLLVLAAVVRGPASDLYRALARPEDAPRQRLFILVPLAATAAGGLLANLLFGPFASVGYLVAGWGDAVGEPVGVRWGRHRYRVPTLGGVRATRSLEGSAAVWSCSILAAFVGLLVLAPSPLAALGVALVCGTGAALVEAISHHGLDNLTIQLTAAGLAAGLIG